MKKLKPEEAADLKTFEGNAQGFRVLTSAEYHPNDGGMRLTYATLASFIKYPWTALPATSGKRPKTEKYGVFKSELASFDEVAKAVGLIRQGGDDWYCRHPFVSLLEAADDFCYGILDLEDGLEMNILEWEDVYAVLKGVLTPNDLDELKPDLEKLSAGRRPPVVRGKVIDAYVEAAASAFIENEEKFLSGEYLDLVGLCDARVRDSVGQAKDLAKTRIFTHPRKVELEIGSYNVMATLLDVICSAVLEYSAHPNKCSFKSKRVVDLIGPTTLPTPEYLAKHSDMTPEYLSLMRAIDFISGCTDHYATYLAKQFNGMGESR